MTGCSDRAPGRDASAGLYCTPEGVLSADRPVQSHRSWCIRALEGAGDRRPGVAEPLRFEIVDDRGEVLRRFVNLHERRMHVVVVRKDLAEFQHLHPEFDAATGRFTLSDLELPNAGEYRLFADFAAAGGTLNGDSSVITATPHLDLRAGDLAEYRPGELATPNRTAISDDYRFELDVPDTLVAGAEARLAITVLESGRPVPDLEPYLGALGHAVVIRDGSLHYVHTHALADRSRQGTVSFAVQVPEPGRYKAFVQFQHRGRVLTAEFVLPAAYEAAAGARAAGGHGTHR